ncbi:substance-P receptor-like [Aplysia californica]|uniref:Substance-P receptor-like n=1 Tax=Aplysia californica TaxID=6500 RepID=A0ABM0JRQ6_APLCA|nr:substance-P receptor-like [Aplysia californica]
MDDRPVFPPLPATTHVSGSSLVDKATSSGAGDNETAYVTTTSSPALPPPLTDVFSFEVWTIFQVTNYVVICGLLSLFGVASNIINIVVFAKQGFQDSMNISLMGLAVSDLCSLITMLWLSFFILNPLFIGLGLPFDAMDVMYLTGAVPHVLFGKITSFITAFITFERCLCIALPLKVKMIITPLRTKIIIVSIYVLMICFPTPFYAGIRLGWELDAFRNETILQISYVPGRVSMEAVTFFIYGVVFSTASFVFVIFCTVILVVKLNSKTKWRQTTAAKGVKAADGAGLKDKKVVKMVTLISTIFIVCFMPPTFFFFAMTLEPEFRFDGVYKNIYMSVWSFSFVTETINSSITWGKTRVCRADLQREINVKPLARTQVEVKEEVMSASGGSEAESEDAGSDMEAGSGDSQTDETR